MQRAEQLHPFAVVVPISEARRLERQRDALKAALQAIGDNLAGLIRDQRTAAEQACLDRARVAIAMVEKDKP